MLLPFAVRHDVDTALSARWGRHYAVPDTQRDRRIEEGLWRRTQALENAAESGWASPYDARRRLLYYRFAFDLVAVPGGRTNISATEVYFFYSLALPAAELDEQITAVTVALHAGAWRPAGDHTTSTSGNSVHGRAGVTFGPGTSGSFVRGDLLCHVSVADRHPVDLAAGRILPEGYRCLDVTITSDAVPSARARLPWDVLAGGMRVKDRRGEPELIEDLSALADLSPFHVEVGCGLSLEAGIPPLHYLHDLYQVTDVATRRFVFAPAQDTVITRFLAAPEQRMPTHASMFLACLDAEPTPGHHALKALRESRHLLGPVITNNFDGLLARTGLPERYVRRYDQAVPHVHIDPRAKALLVVGSHADRRKVQHRARARGMRVVFCDPEGFWKADGSFTPYPVEGARDGDLLCRTTAAVGLTDLAAKLLTTT